MTNLTPQQLRELSKDRKRPLSMKLGSLEDSLVRETVSFWQDNQENNILDSSISLRKERNLPVEGKGALGSSYSQVALQGLREGGDLKNAKDYVEPIAHNIVEAVEQVIGPCFRMRISALNPSGEIPEHIDMPGQVRVLCLLGGEQDFIIKNRVDTLQVDMSVGELWFINTAWPHSVMNNGPNNRLALLIDLAGMPEQLVVMASKVG